MTAFTLPHFQVCPVGLGKNARPLMRVYEGIGTSSSSQFFPPSTLSVFACCIFVAQVASVHHSCLHTLHSFEKLSFSLATVRFVLHTSLSTFQLQFKQQNNTHYHHEVLSSHSRSCDGCCCQSPCHCLVHCRRWRGPRTW